MSYLDVLFNVDHRTDRNHSLRHHALNAAHTHTAVSQQTQSSVMSYCTHRNHSCGKCLVCYSRVAANTSLTNFKCTHNISFAFVPSLLHYLIYSYISKKTEISIVMCKFVNSLLYMAIYQRNCGSKLSLKSGFILQFKLRLKVKLI